MTHLTGLPLAKRWPCHVRGDSVVFYVASDLHAATRALLGLGLVVVHTGPLSLRAFPRANLRHPTRHTGPLPTQARALGR